MSAGSGNGAEIERQAAAWAVRSAERRLDEAEREQLETWLESDDRHLGAFVRAQALWLDSDRIAAFDSRTRSEPVAEPEPRRWPRYAMAASLAIAMVGGGIGYDRLAGRITTERGEVRRIALADGSTVVLNGASAIQIRFDEDERRIILRGGEASFDVAHNSERPFIVSAEDLSVRAVGTEFVVGIADSQVEVTVAEGVVALAAEGAETAPPRLLRRNEQFILAETGGRKATLEPEDVERQTAWREGLLVFDGQRLGAAAAEVNRHSDLQVVIDDPTLARAEFIGVFKLGDARAFANSAAYAFNGEVIDEGATLRLIRQRNSPSH